MATLEEKLNEALAHLRKADADEAHAKWLAAHVKQHALLNSDDGLSQTFVSILIPHAISLD